MHEIGHGLGFGHPNTFNTFNLHYDTDENALNPMVLDPVDPDAALLYTETRNPQAVMSNDRSRIGPHLFFTELTNDDRGGRDALYPSPAVCPGDCSGNGETDVTELVTMISIALGEGEWSRCHRGDLNRDGGIQVDEILRAVLRALEGGCEDLAPGAEFMWDGPRQVLRASERCHCARRTDFSLLTRVT